jgi:hypothetical protein
MPFNNFDALLSDLAAVQKLKESGQLLKALDAADAIIGAPVTQLRAAKARIDNSRAIQSRQQKPGPALREIVPNRPTTPRAPTKAQLRARFAAGREAILAKAMSLLAAGEISATQVAAVEARLHRIAAGL